MLANIRRLLGAATLALAASASPDAEESGIEGLGTVIIGGSTCQMIGLDDGRFFTLQDGASHGVALPALTRVRLHATRATQRRCKSADPVDVKSLEIIRAVPGAP